MDVGIMRVRVMGISNELMMTYLLKGQRICYIWWDRGRWIHKKNGSLKKEKFEKIKENYELKRLNIALLKEVAACKKKQECVKGKVDVLSTDLEELKNDLNKKDKKLRL